MERTIWLLSYIPARALVIILGVCDYVVCKLFYQAGILTKLFAQYKYIFILLGVIVLISCIACAVKGGKIGYNYVEMGRSRRWHYRANEYQRKDDHLSNTIYWAGKFACFPIIIVLLIILIIGIIYFVNL